MIIIDDEHGTFDVCLSDDGTLDTVIEVCPYDSVTMQNETREIRFSTEYAADFRDPDTRAMTDDGFAELATEAVVAYIEQYLI